MSLADEIRKDPLRYLPEISLMGLWKFQNGYSFRCYLEGRFFDDDFHGRGREFEDWIRARFSVPPDSCNVVCIIDSFSGNNEDAFYFYFALRDEFLKSTESNSREAPPSIQSEPADLIQLLKKIRERPPLYFGTTHFQDFYLLMLGDERAFSDLGLAPGLDRKIWAEFKSWMEETQNKASIRRPWHKIISYWGGSGESALKLFYKWLDQFAATIGQPDLFQVQETFWQRFRRP
jgi:hypothetical protein